MIVPFPTQKSSSFRRKSESSIARRRDKESHTRYRSRWIPTFVGMTLVLFVLMTGFAFADTAPVSNDLRDALETAAPEIKTLGVSKDELGAIYAARDYKQAWNFGGAEKETTIGPFLTSLEQLIDYHGLRKEPYPIELMRTLIAAKDDKANAHLDLLVTASVLRLAHDLHGDTVDLTDDYPGWNFHRAGTDIPALLGAAMTTGSINEFITSLMPKQPAYGKLAAALTQYRAYHWDKIDGGAPLRPNDHDPRVPQLRARLQAEAYLPPAANDQPPDDFFDDELRKALIAYQLRNGLEPDGHVGAWTLDALNTSVDTRVEQIRANMERWRHMPDDFPPERFAAVNIADATIQINEGGKAIYHGIVVIGKVDRKTPFIQSHIRSMIVNPIWHVPTKIARKDILPKLRKDPHYLEKLGFVISGEENDPQGTNIDWSSMPEREFNFRLRQAPGKHNSLGHLKFDFDNDFAVYMHGTPHQELFAKAQRNFSSGCIRLHDPDQVGEILLKDTSGHWDATKIASEIGKGKTRWVSIANPMPLYVLYWSVFTDPETGAVDFRKDVYDYDRIFDPTFTPIPATQAGE